MDSIVRECFFHQHRSNDHISTISNLYCPCVTYKWKGFMYQYICISPVESASSEITSTRFVTTLKHNPLFSVFKILKSKTSHDTICAAASRAPMPDPVIAGHHGDKNTPERRGGITRRRQRGRQAQLNILEWRNATIIHVG